MLAARVEPKNAPQESEKTDNFKPLVFREFQAGVDTSAHSSASVTDPTGLFMAAPQVTEMCPSALIHAPHPATRARSSWDASAKIVTCGLRGCMPPYAMSLVTNPHTL